MKRTAWAALCAAALGLPGCASIVDDGMQTLTIKTTPEGAVCEISREGSVIGVVNPTPGSIAIGKSAKAIEVKCTKDNLSAVVRSDSTAGAWVWGNILLGGVIGWWIDHEQGSAYEYDAVLQLELKETPEEAVTESADEEATPES